MLSLFAATTVSLALAAAAPTGANSPKVVKTSATNACRASLSLADARALALETPNARAFVQNLNATLKTEVVGHNPDGSVTVRVTNAANHDEVVDTYTINLRTGRILDDAEEPAEDAQTAAVRDKLIAKHCAAR